MNSVQRKWEFSDKSVVLASLAAILEPKIISTKYHSYLFSSLFVLEAWISQAF